MPKLFPSFLRFALYFFVVTCAFGLIGMLINQTGSTFLNQALSLSILFPYLISFFLMTKHFIKSNQTIPQGKQRWQLSLGCLMVFWLYTALTFLIGMLISGAQFDSAALIQALTTPLFVIIFGTMFLGFNLLLFVVSYFFLGKPATMMLSQLKR